MIICNCGSIITELGTCNLCGGTVTNAGCWKKGLLLPITKPLKKQTDKYHSRKELCIGCKYLSPKGCLLYIKPCTVKQLWNDQIDPPTNCPNKEKFL